MKELRLISFHASWKKEYILKGHSSENPINMEVEQGKWVYIIGLNGLGKSTLVKAMAGIATIIQGGVLFGNTVVPNFDLRKRYETGFFNVPQHENYKFRLDWSDAIGYSGRSAKAKEIIKLEKDFRSIGILGMSNNFLNSRLFDLATAILMKPEVLILDEITPAFSEIESNFDGSPYKFIKSLLPETIVFFTEHDIKLGLDVMDEFLWLRENKKPVHRKAPSPIEILELNKKLENKDDPNIDPNDSKENSLAWREAIDLDCSPLDNLNIALHSLKKNQISNLRGILKDFPFLNSRNPCAELSGGQRLVLIWFMLVYTGIGLLPLNVIQHLDPTNRTLINKWEKQIYE